MADAFTRLAEALADRYRVVRELGAGGMATVYLAHDLRHNRKVAVKVLRPELAAALGHERFLREIEIAAGLSHPHILPVYDSGRAVGRLDGMTAGDADLAPEQQAAKPPSRRVPLDAAFADLDQAVRERTVWLPFEAEFPYMAPLRADPRFAALLKEMGLDRTTMEMIGS